LNKYRNKYEDKIMGFSDDIKKFSNKTKENMQEKVKEVEINAEKILHDLLGEDISLIENISFDTDVGKFHNVVAPESVIDKLREAGLLKS
jgi:hypothetical protein